MEQNLDARTVGHAATAFVHLLAGAQDDNVDAATSLLRRTRQQG